MDIKLPKVIVTSVVRGSQQGESHGGVFTVDFESQTSDQVIDWNTGEIDFTGRGADRGLRGIAFDNDDIYIAASDELFCYSQNFEIEPLRDVILGLDERAWESQTHRQNEYAVHQQTQFVVMVFTSGEGWPNIEVAREDGWDLLAETAIPLMYGILDEFYPKGGSIIRAMAAKLPAGNTIKPHLDKHPSFHAGHRIHVPITTNHRVRFMIDGRPYQLEVGKAYELNNQKNHSVMNKGREDRITFIFDYVPPDRIDRAAQPEWSHF